MVAKDFNVVPRILITGASSGLGLDLANKLAAKNNSLIVTGRNRAKLENLAKQFNNNNSFVIKPIIADLCNADNLAYLIESIDTLNGIVLNAGIVEYVPVKMINPDKIRRIFQVNFDANVMIIQSLLKKRKIINGASIVFVSSIAALSAVPGTALYAASKAALNSYAKVLANELASQNIRVNIVSPGIVKTDLIKRENITTSDQFTKLEDRYPLGFGKPEDISNIIMFLLSEDSKWVTGSNIIIDGGHMLQ
jgi:NAD(P)-dependent dehydrogenase (short-subunit alcohol dehydrogenase family)